jgi:hypothetical protein
MYPMGKTNRSTPVYRHTRGGPAETETVFLLHKTPLTPTMGDLWTAARANDVATLTSFFSKGIGARARDDKGNTLLHHAAETGSMNVLELLFNRGVDLDAKNNEGFTVRIRSHSSNCFEIHTTILNFHTVWSAFYHI